jgi:hypothetical protein
MPALNVMMGFIDMMEGRWGWRKEELGIIIVRVLR